MKVEIEFKDGNKDCFDDATDVCHLKKTIAIEYYINESEKEEGITTDTFLSKGCIKSITITDL